MTHLSGWNKFHSSRTQYPGNGYLACPGSSCCRKPSLLGHDFGPERKLREKGASFLSIFFYAGHFIIWWRIERTDDNIPNNRKFIGEEKSDSVTGSVIRQILDLTHFQSDSLLANHHKRKKPKRNLKSEKMSKVVLFTPASIFLLGVGGWFMTYGIGISDPQHLVRRKKWKICEDSCLFKFLIGQRYQILGLFLQNLAFFHNYWILQEIVRSLKNRIIQFFWGQFESNNRPLCHHRLFQIHSSNRRWR